MMFLGLLLGTTRRHLLLTTEKSPLSQLFTDETCQFPSTLGVREIHDRELFCIAVCYEEVGASDMRTGALS